MEKAVKAGSSACDLLFYSLSTYAVRVSMGSKSIHECELLPHFD